MGNDCVACTPSEKYKRYFTMLNISELKDLWPAIKVYNIKKIFDRSSIKRLDSSQTEIPYDNFKKMFSEFENYEEPQIKRLFEFFDMENQGFVDWNSFFSAITICYFCEENTLALIMFMMYDLSLDFKLDKNYLELLLQNNQKFLKTAENGIQPFWEDVIVELQSNQELSLQKWLKVAEDYFELSKFRTIFNLFQQQKLQKELVRHFSSWNNVFEAEQQKFVGYLINIKWFQSWALYIQHHYNIKIDIYRRSTDPIGTIKTLKSTTFKTTRKMDKSKIDSKNSLNGFREIQSSKNKSCKTLIKNFDFVHGNLGQRPREITNNQIQGEYQDILKSQIAQNIDYVIVAEKVWRYLQNIYGGYPQFRRTGFDGIELYPKIIRAYLALFKGSIDYSSEIRREVSAYYKIQQLLVKSCDIKSEDVSKYAIFFKTVKMKKWELVEDPAVLFAEITPEDLIFLVCIPLGEKDQFLKKHQKVQINVTEVNLGDTLLLRDQNQIQKAIFMGKTIEGKYILHLQGKHYTEDICLLQSQLQKRCTLLQENIEKNQNQKQGFFKQLIGLPGGAGLGFINSTFLQIFNTKQIRKFLSMFTPKKEEQKLVYRLGVLYNLLKKKGRIQSGFIKQTVQTFLNKFNQFQVSMCADFIEELLDELSGEMQQSEMPDIITNNYNIQIEKQVSCLSCKKEFLMKSSNFVYRLHLPEEDYNYFQIFWVPNQGKNILKYLIKIQRLATLGDFMAQIENQLHIQSSSYILAQVYANDIAKNFNSVPRSTTLASLKIRENNKFFVYELKSNFSSFVSKFYNNSESLDQDCIKKDKFIDCNHPEKGWIFGKIVQIQFLPYTQTEIVKVMHKFSKNESWQVSYQVIEGEVARYPLKSHKNCDQYHLRMNQRCYSQTSNSMQLVNVPLVVALPAWIRWKEFSFYVYLQIRRFIADQYSFNNQSEENIIPSCRQLKKSSQLSMAEKFKEYRNSSRFPYTLNLCDYEGRCVVCYKFVKSVVFKGENEHYCQGCKLSNNDPISWQAKPADLVICIDWKNHATFKKDIIIQTPFYTDQNLYRQKQKYELQTFLSNMDNKHVENEQFLCCNVKDEKIVSDKIIKSSNIFVIYVQRIVVEEDGFKKVMKRPVKYVEEGLMIGDKKYDLIGLTSIEGGNLNIRYKTFIRKSKKQWYWYDNQIVKIVNSSYVEKECVLTLYYELCQS